MYGSGSAPKMIGGYGNKWSDIGRLFEANAFVGSDTSRLKLDRRQSEIFKLRLPARPACSWGSQPDQHM